MNRQEIRRGFALEEIARSYPVLFSQKRFEEWLSLFDPRAMMVRVENGRPVSCRGIFDGMPEQREYAAENEIFSEEWHGVEIRQYGNIAVLKADYILTTDREIRKGLDLLTLCRDSHGWLITNLTYEQRELIER